MDGGTVACLQNTIGSRSRPDVENVRAEAGVCRLRLDCRCQPDPGGQEGDFVGNLLWPVRFEWNGREVYASREAARSVSSSMCLRAAGSLPHAANAVQRAGGLRSAKHRLKGC